MKNIIVIILIMILTLLNVLQLTWDHIAYPLYKNVVPDEKTALAVAKAVLDADAGGNFDINDLEVVSIPNNNEWYVCERLKPNYVGGPAGVVIRKRDGKILRFNRIL